MPTTPTKHRLFEENEATSFPPPPQTMPASNQEYDDSDDDDFDDEELSRFQRFKKRLFGSAKKTDMVKSSNKKRFNLWHHIKAHPWRYGIGFVLMVGTVALFAIPGFAPAIGLGSTLGYLTFATALKLGISFVGAQALLGTAASLIAFFAPVIAGYTLKLLGAAIQLGLRILLAAIVITIAVVSVLAAIGALAAVALGAIIVLGASFLTSALGNLFSGKGFTPTSIIWWSLLDEPNRDWFEKNAEKAHASRSRFGKLMAWAGTIFIGLPLRILANLIDATTLATAATAAIGVILSAIASVIAGAILFIPLIIVGLIEYAAYKLIDYTGRLISGLGRFCLGEGFNTEPVSFIKKYDERIPSVPTSREEALAKIQEIQEQGIHNSLLKLGKQAKSGSEHVDNPQHTHYDSPINSRRGSSSSSPTTYPTSSRPVTVEDAGDDDMLSANNTGTFGVK